MTFVQLATQAMTVCKKSRNLPLFRVCLFRLIVYYVLPNRSNLVNLVSNKAQTIFRTTNQCLQAYLIVGIQLEIDVNLHGYHAR